MNWLSKLSPFRKAWSRSVQESPSHCRPTLELLEDRCVPSTMSSITSNFNGTAIPAGDAIWFNAAFKASGLGTGPVSIHVTDQSIRFTSGGTAYNVAVPDSILNFSAANTIATTSFDAGQNAWVTNLPMNWSGNAFLGGATFVAASGLRGGANPVTWSGNFASDTAGVTIKWQWGAAVYTNFGSDYNALNVKPLDSNSATVYHNSDHAGTPEAFKSFVVGGARGGGGSNWTGSYSATRVIIPAVGTQTEPATISGYATDDFGVALAGVTITLRDSSGNVIQQVTTDVNGFYIITSVPPGVYSLTASKTAYRTISATAGTDDGVPDGTSGISTINDVSLESGDVAINYDFVLAPTNV